MDTSCVVGSPPTCSGQETHIGWDGPRILEACSEGLKSSSSSSSVFSSDDSPEPVTDGSAHVTIKTVDDWIKNWGVSFPPPEDCAGILLACLHCRFREFMHLLVDTFDRAVSHCFPSVNHVTESIEGDHQGWECLTCNLGLDWNFCNSCQDSAELLELAMEISEVCYRWEEPGKREGGTARFNTKVALKSCHSNTAVPNQSAVKDHQMSSRKWSPWELECWVECNNGLPPMRQKWNVNLI